MKVVLFGQSGQVGEAVLRQFGEHFDWICPDRRTRQGDLLSPEAIYEYLCRIKSDAIVNAAAFTAVDKAGQFHKDAEIINANSVLSMARAARETGTYLLHLITDYVFDGSGTRAWKEEDRVNPINAYGKTKALAEKWIAQQTAEATVLRLSWLHAPGHKNFVTAICDRLKNDEVLRVVDDQWGSPTVAADVADVIGKFLNSYKHGKILRGIYHFANAGFCSRYQCALEILKRLQTAEVPWAFGKKIEPVKTADYPLSEPRPLNCRLNTQKIRRELKIAPRSWQQALDATLNSYY